MSNGTNPNPGTANDPGVHLGIDFTQCNMPPQVARVRVKIHLSIPGSGGKKATEHQSWFTMDANGGIAGENLLDLSQRVTFLVPFVDVNWEKEKHYQQKVDYSLEIIFSGLDYQPLKPEFIRGSMEGSDNVYRGPVVYEAGDTLPSGMPMARAAEPLAASNAKSLMEFAQSLADDGAISEDFKKYAGDIGSALSSLISSGSDLPKSEPQSRGISFGGVSLEDIEETVESGIDAAKDLLDSDPAEAVDNLSKSVAYLQENIEAGTDPRKGGFNLDASLDQIADKAIGMATNSLEFQQVIYTADGVWWHMYYLNNGPTATYLKDTKTGAYTSMYSCPSSLGNHRVEEYESCYLPYPRLQGGSSAPADHEIQVSYFIKDFRFTPPQGLQPYTGPFEIKGTHEPKK